MNLSILLTPSRATSTQAAPLARPAAVEQPVPDAFALLLQAGAATTGDSQPTAAAGPVTPPSSGSVSVSALMPPQAPAPDVALDAALADAAGMGPDVGPNAMPEGAPGEQGGEGAAKDGQSVPPLAAPGSATPFSNWLFSALGFSAGADAASASDSAGAWQGAAPAVRTQPGATPAWAPTPAVDAIAVDDRSAVAAPLPAEPVDKGLQVPSADALLNDMPTADALRSSISPLPDPATAEAASPFQPLPLTVSPPALLPLQTAPVAWLPTPLDPAWAAQMEEHIEWQLDSGQDAAEIQLHPAELGSLSVRIETHGDTAHVSIAVSREATRALLQTALPQLRELLEQRGLSLGRAQIERNRRGDATQPGDGAQGVTRMPGRSITRVVLVDAYV